MNLGELKSSLAPHAAHHVALTLPDGGRVPAHYHITEVGHIAKKFVDCGGTFRTSETCVLQTYFGSPQDDGHRLTAGKLLHILELAKTILPTDALPVEVEYEDGVVSQFPLLDIMVTGGQLVLQLGLKHTDCLAKDKCGIAEDGRAEEEMGCCGGTAKAGGCC